MRDDTIVETAEEVTADAVGHNPERQTARTGSGHAPSVRPGPAVDPLLIMVACGGSLLLYLGSLAPGITWAHQGADSGELIAAAVVGGVPHPPGYPLYTVLLRGWLALVGIAAPASDMAWRGNLLSALLAALSVGVTAVTVSALLDGNPRRRLWALAAAAAWAVSPLLWSQALITEVYALHALVLTLLGWQALSSRPHPWLLAPILTVGMANHLTTLLLLPAVLYLMLSHAHPARRRAIIAAVTVGLVAGGLLHLRTPLAAAAQPTPPVNWGFADNAAGFLWLISGQAYRSYLFGVPTDALFGQVTGWAHTIVSQLTPVGLAVALFGLAEWDQHAPRRRNFALLWVLPVSLYTIVYYTRDSEIYLLPVSWLIAVLFGSGLAALAAWISARQWKQVHRLEGSLVGLVAVGLILVTAYRYPSISLRHDTEAIDYLQEVITIVEPGSIIITNRDRETFALWYGAWGSGDLFEGAPDTVLVNHALYQFDWYRRLAGVTYTGVPGVDESTSALIAANADLRPIYVTEKLSTIPESSLDPVGPIWRYEPAAQQP